MPAVAPKKSRRAFALGAASLALATVLGLAIVRPGFLRESWRPLLILGSNATVILMFLRLARVEHQHREQAERYAVVVKAPPRNDDLEFLRDQLQDIGRPQVSAMQERLYEQVRAYVRGNATEPVDLPHAAEPRGGGAQGAARARGVQAEGRLFVVIPKESDPYWLGCNRAVEAMKYCRRVHTEGFEIALWVRPVPRGGRFVDLIG
jgi:hypothetical protein